VPMRSPRLPAALVLFLLARPAGAAMTAPFGITASSCRQAIAAAERTHALPLVCWAPSREWRAAGATLEAVR
jgi:hypothetical protein